MLKRHLEQRRILGFRGVLFREVVIKKSFPRQVCSHRYLIQKVEQHKDTFETHTPANTQGPPKPKTLNRKS